MKGDDPRALSNVHGDWLGRSVAEAKALLPRLLNESLPGLRLKLTTRFYTPGMLQCLTELAHKALERFPRHTFDLTSIAVEMAGYLEVPPEEEAAGRRLCGNACRIHALALRAIRRFEEAGRAIDVAREQLDALPPDARQRATLDLAEAQVLHGLGRHANALMLARRAASTLLERGDRAEYLDARAAEAAMRAEAGGPGHTSQVWDGIARVAEERADRYLAAGRCSRMGLHELRFGSPQKAWELLSSALLLFPRHGTSRDRIAVHRARSRAAFLCGWLNKAIAENYTAHAELVRIGDLDEAAPVAARGVELLLQANRRGEAVLFAQRLPALFLAAGLAERALEAFFWLNVRATANVLDAEDATFVRIWFDDLLLKPLAAFQPPYETVPARAIAFGDSYLDALQALRPEAVATADTLAHRIAAAPETGTLMNDRTDVRALSSRDDADRPVVRIFYCFDDDAVSLLYVGERKPTA
jgi:tetratricopeptide (TPR) repeat protein